MRTFERSNTDAEPEHDGMASPTAWEATRLPCRGPCWNGYWTVSRLHPPGVYENVLNASGKVKLFRSEKAAQQEVVRRNSVKNSRRKLLEVGNE